MVKLHIKRGDESQFLVETTVEIPISELTVQLVRFYNGRLKVDRLCQGETLEGKRACLKLHLTCKVVGITWLVKTIVSVSLLLCLYVIQSARTKESSSIILHESCWCALIGIPTADSVPPIIDSRALKREWQIKKIVYPPVSLLVDTLFHDLSHSDQHTFQHSVCISSRDSAAGGAWSDVAPQHAGADWRASRGAEASGWVQGDVHPQWRVCG